MKKEVLNYEDFKAKDIYSIWLQSCKEAAKSICVISPYVDNTVKNLLTSKKIGFFITKSIYTRVDSDTIFERPYQIRALINSKKNGIRIYHIKDLHAKALIIDNRYISIGSQNFTSAGRKNKETSMMSTLNFSSSEYLKSINSWIENAEEIDIEYLLTLESKLKKFRPLIDKLRDEHELVFNQIEAFESNRKQQEFIRNILILKSQTKNSFASENIYLTKTHIDNWETSQTTFLVDSGRDLTKWKVNGVDRNASLVRLEYYPCVNTSNNSIAYLRLTKTRVSFYLTGIDFGWYEINSKSYKLSIKCPQVNTTDVNFQIVLKLMNCERNVLDFYFDGAEFNFVKGQFYDKSNEEELLNYFISNDDEKNKLLKKCFRGVNLEKIARPITNYFDGFYYKFFIVDYKDNPIIIAQKIS